MAKQEIEWTRINPDVLPKAAKTAYERMLSAKQAFEAATTAEMRKAKTIPQGKQVKYSYKFGGISIGFVDPTALGDDGSGGSALFS